MALLPFLTGGFGMGLPLIGLPFGGFIIMSISFVGFAAKYTISGEESRLVVLFGPIEYLLCISYYSAPYIYSPCWSTKSAMQ